MNVPKERAAIFTFVLVITGVIAFVITGFIVGAGAGAGAVEAWDGALASQFVLIALRLLVRDVGIMVERRLDLDRAR